MRKLGRYLSLSIMLIFSFYCSEARYENLLHKTYAERYQAFDTLFYDGMQNKLDSVAYFRETEELRKLAEKENDDELELAAEVMHAAYYAEGKQPNYEYFIAAITPVLKKAQKQNNIYAQIKCHILLGVHYHERLDKYPPAAYHYQQAYNLLQKVDVKEYPNKKLPLSLIGKANFNFNDQELAKKVLKEADAIDIPLVPRGPKLYIYINVKNTLGLVYRQQSIYDSAIACFRGVYDIAKREHNQDWINIAEANIGSCYYNSGNYKEALALMDHGIPANVGPDDTDNAFQHLLEVGDMRVKLHDYTGAKPYLMFAYSLLNSTSRLAFSRYRISRVLADYYAGLNDLQKAHLYADSAFAANDSIKIYARTGKYLHAQHMAERDYYTSEINRTESEHRTQVKLRNGLLLLVFMAGLIGLLLVNRQKLKNAQKLKLVEAEKTKVQELATLQLEEFTKNIHEKNELIERFTIEIEKYQALPCSNEIPDRQNSIQTLQTSVILTEDQWISFQSLFNKVHPGYINRVNERYYDLTVTELRFLVLSKLGLRHKEMAAMLGVSLEAIRVCKHRLLKKIQLPEGLSIEELVRSI